MSRRNEKNINNVFAPMFKDVKKLFEGAEQLDMSGITDTQLMNLAISIQNQGQQATNQYNQTISNLAKQMESVKQKQQTLNVQSEKDKMVANKEAEQVNKDQQSQQANGTQPIADSLRTKSRRGVNEMNNVFTKDNQRANDPKENKHNVTSDVVFIMLDDVETNSTSIVKLYKSADAQYWVVKVMLSTNQMKDFLGKLTFDVELTKEDIFEYLHYTEMFKSLDELDIDEVDTLLNSLKRYQKAAPTKDKK